MGNVICKNIYSQTTLLHRFRSNKSYKICVFQKIIDVEIMCQIDDNMRDIMRINS